MVSSWHSFLAGLATLADRAQSWLELINHQGDPYWRVQLTAFVGFFSFCCIEGLLTLRPIGKAPPKDLVTDMFHWLLTPVFRNLSRFAVVAFIVFHASLFGHEASLQSYTGFGPVARQPHWLMMIEVLVLTDFMSYWSHRLFHTVPMLWRFHAIHHSATTIRWSTTGRVHPINELVNYLAAIVPCFLLGFPITVVVAMVPVLMWYALAAHADWNPTFGFLGRVFASPRFHRWHHTRSHEGGNRNFSNVFLLWDRWFGTYYLPEGHVPLVFGLDPGSDDVPTDFFGQIAYPFRRNPGAVNAAVSSEADASAPSPSESSVRPRGKAWSPLLSDSNPPHGQG